MKKIVLMAALFVAEVLYSQGPPTGGGMHGPGVPTPNVSVDMYLPFLVVAAVVFIAFYAYRRRQAIK